MVGSEHGTLLGEEDVDVVDIALVELEVVGEEGGAEAGYANEVAEITWQVGWWSWGSGRGARGEIGGREE